MQANIDSPMNDKAKLVYSESPRGVKYGQENQPKSSSALAYFQEDVDRSPNKMVDSSQVATNQHKVRRAPTSPFNKMGST